MITWHSREKYRFLIGERVVTGSLFLPKGTIVSGADLSEWKMIQDSQEIDRYLSEGHKLATPSLPPMYAVGWLTPIPPEEVEDETQLAALSVE